MSEKLTTSYIWKWSFRERRCFIPMTSWDEWPGYAGGKQRVSISRHGEPIFAAAGLYATNEDPKTGEKVDVFTMCTVPPTEYLDTVHDRAPMVLYPSEYETRLDGEAEAEALLSRAPANEQFLIVPIGAPSGSGKGKRV